MGERLASDLIHHAGRARRGLGTGGSNSASNLLHPFPLNPVAVQEDSAKIWAGYGLRRREGRNLSLWGGGSSNRANSFPDCNLQRVPSATRGNAVGFCPGQLVRVRKPKQLSVTRPLYVWVQEPTTRNGSSNGLLDGSPDGPHRPRAELARTARSNSSRRIGPRAGARSWAKGRVSKRWEVGVFLELACVGEGRVVFPRRSRSPVHSVPCSSNMLAATGFKKRSDAPLASVLVCSSGAWLEGF